MSEAIFVAQEYMLICANAGAIRIFGYFKDDEETELFWIVEDIGLKTIYSAESNEELAKTLIDLKCEDRARKIASMYESGDL